MSQDGIDLRWRPLAAGDTAEGLVYATIADGQRIEWQGPEGLAYRLLQWIGAAAPSTPFLYTVETGVDEADEAELMDWYERDHLPRLGAVPGVIAAARYKLLQGEAPRYLAAYWLTAPGVFESPAWLDARNTEWTARMRPCFRDPRRTMRRLETSA